MTQQTPHFSMSRRYDEIDRFLVFVEQLQVACELLAADTLATTRTALVCVDNLANVILHGHAEAVFATGEGSHWCKRKRYTHKERREVLGDFDRMLVVASKDSGGPAWRAVPAIADESDAAVMRVAHSYRNGVYHEDRHNAALIAPLTVLYAKALGRTFTRSHGHGWSYSVDAGRAEALSRFGYAARQDDHTSARMLDFGVAASCVTQNLTSCFEVDEHTLREHLARDIIVRCRRCAQIVVDLLDREMPADRLEWVFSWSQFWAKHGADEKWLALQDKRDALADELPAVVGSQGLSNVDTIVVAYHEAEQAYIERAHELQRGFRPSVTWADAPRLGKLGERLSNAKSLASLLSRYEQIDRDVEQLEVATSEAVRTWDQMVENEVDRLREGD
jgi:hypothetical protein